jgi:hypothetical protein
MSGWFLFAACFLFVTGHPVAGAWCIVGAIFTA